MSSGSPPKKPLPTKEAPKELKYIMVYKRAAIITRREWKTVLLLNTLTLIPGMLDAYQPFLIQEFIRSATNKNYELLIDTGMKFLILAMLSGIFKPLHTYFHEILMRRILCEFRKEIIERPLYYDDAWWRDHPKEEMLTLMNLDITSWFQWAHSFNYTRQIIFFITCCTHIWVMWQIHWKIALVLILMMPPYAEMYDWYKKRHDKIGSRALDYQVDCTRISYELLTKFNQTKEIDFKMLQEFKDTCEEMYREQVYQHWWIYLFELYREMHHKITMWIIYFWGCYVIISGHESLHLEHLSIFVTNAISMTRLYHWGRPISKGQIFISNQVHAKRFADILMYDTLVPHPYDLCGYENDNVKKNQ